MRFYLISLLVAGGLCVGGAAEAQRSTVPTARPAYERGCRGVEVQMEIDLLTRLPVRNPVVAEVEEGSPAEVAGLQMGDSIVSQGGVGSTAGIPRQRYAVGDTIRLVVRRGGRDLPVVLVMGRRVADRARGAEVCRPVGGAR